MWSEKNSTIIANAIYHLNLVLKMDHNVVCVLFEFKYVFTQKY